MKSTEPARSAPRKSPSPANPAGMIHGLHEAFIALGVFTILSSVVFYRLKADDGRAVSHQKDLHLT